MLKTNQFYFIIPLGVDLRLLCKIFPLSFHSSRWLLSLSASCSPPPPEWMNDSASVSLCDSGIDQTPAAAVTSWKDKAS